MTCLATSASLAQKLRQNFFAVSGKVIAQGEKEDNGQVVRPKS